MAVVVLSFIVIENKRLIASPITLQLAEVLLPLFDHVRLCAPSHSHWKQPRHFVPCGFAGQNVADWAADSEVFLLSFLQDNIQVQQVSILIFKALVTILLEKEMMDLKTHVRESLLPLFIHCHNKNRRVAQVRSRGLWVSPCQGALLPPALVPGGLKPPPGLGKGTGVLCPGLWGHLCISAALQASQETLLCVAKFLKTKDLEKLVKKKKLWKFAERLVRMAWKPQPQPGEAPCLWCSLCAVGSCGPAQCWPRGRTGSSPGSCGPKPGAHRAPAQQGCGAGQHRSSPGTPVPVPLHSLAPAAAGRASGLSGQGRLGLGMGSTWRRGRAHPDPSLPPLSAAGRGPEPSCRAPAPGPAIPG